MPDHLNERDVRALLCDAAVAQLCSQDDHDAAVFLAEESPDLVAIVAHPP